MTAQDRKINEVVDEVIRRRFRHCQTLPLFPEASLPPGFFQRPDLGEQLHLTDALSFRGENEG